MRQRLVGVPGGDRRVHRDDRGVGARGADRGDAADRRPELGVDDRRAERRLGERRHRMRHLVADQPGAEIDSRSSCSVRRCCCRRIRRCFRPRCSRSRPRAPSRRRPLRRCRRLRRCPSGSSNRRKRRPRRPNNRPPRSARAESRLDYRRAGGLVIIFCRRVFILPSAAGDARRDARSDSGAGHPRSSCVLACAPCPLRSASVFTARSLS